ncbi:MAG: hypothetical protein GX592_02745 [Clostridiales bacterium]|nr:hypothetical protein [Clostridiales bacterium]
MKAIVVGSGALADALKTAVSGSRAELSGAFESARDPGIARCGADVALLCASDINAAIRLAELGLDVAAPCHIAANLEDALRLDMAFRARGRRLIPLFFDRFSGNVEDVSSAIGRGAIGAVGVADMLSVCPELPDGGSAMRLLYPALDTAVRWLGEPVDANGFRAAKGGTDCAAVTVRFRSGALLNLQAVYGLCGSAFNFTYELSGSLGNLRYDQREARPVVFEPEQSTPSDPPPSQLGAAVEALISELPSRRPGLPENALRLARVLDEAFSKGGYSLEAR